MPASVSADKDPLDKAAMGPSIAHEVQGLDGEPPASHRASSNTEEVATPIRNADTIVIHEEQRTDEPGVSGIKTVSIVSCTQELLPEEGLADAALDRMKQAPRVAGRKNGQCQWRAGRGSTGSDTEQRHERI